MSESEGVDDSSCKCQWHGPAQTTKGRVMDAQWQVRFQLPASYWRLPDLKAWRFWFSVGAVESTYSDVDDRKEI